MSREPRWGGERTEYAEGASSKTDASETAMMKILLTFALIALATPAQAQDYPRRPIKAVTTTSAGGISDIFMRALGDELLKRWGQPIVVENRPGGMQNVGARACTEAPPDGYTICILNAEPIAYNQFLLKSMPFDPEKGLQPVTNLYHLIQTSPPTSRKTARRRKRSSRRRALSRSKSPTGCLLGFDAGRLDDRPPLFGLGLVEGGERFRGLLVPREYLLADVGEPLAYRRVGERLDHRGVELCHDLLRRVLGNPPE